MPSYPPKFQPGDTVTIRAWDDMFSQYGSVRDVMFSQYGSPDGLGIKTPYIVFSSGMKQYCGHFYTVESVTTTAVGSWCSFADVSYDFPVCSLVLPVFESSLTFDDLLKGAS